MIIKTYKEFKESFTITLDQLPCDWKEGEKIAFIDFKGIKNIPVHISDKDEEQE